MTDELKHNIAEIFRVARSSVNGDKQTLINMLNAEAELSQYIKSLEDGQVRPDTEESGTSKE